MMLFRPRIKAIINVCAVIVSGLLSNALINSLTYQNQIIWRYAFKNLIFWILIGFIILYLIYTYFATDKEISLKQKLSDEYFVQMTKQVIPKIAEESCNAIVSGDYSKFDKLNTIFKKIKNN